MEFCGNFLISFPGRFYRAYALCRNSHVRSDLCRLATLTGFEPVFCLMMSTLVRIRRRAS